jgi:cobalt/nickel transport system ATP-binding protein
MRFRSYSELRDPETVGPEAAADREASARSELTASPSRAATSPAEALHPPAVVAAGLRFRYPGGPEILRGIDLEIAQGESVAIIGPNGTGKSTLILHFNGILRGQGRLHILGLPVENKHLREIRAQVGVVFQDPDDQLFLPTLEQDVAFGPANMGVAKGDIPERVDEALAAVGLPGAGDRSPHHLSFGEKKRAAMATVLAMRPRMLVLDEPTSNLDPKGRRELLDVLRAEQATKIVVTHDLAAAYELCKRVLIMDQGHIVADGPRDQILADEDLLAAHDLELPYPPAGLRVSARDHSRRLLGHDHP